MLTIRRPDAGGVTIVTIDNGSATATWRGGKPVAVRTGILQWPWLHYEMA